MDSQAKKIGMVRKGFSHVQISPPNNIHTARNYQIKMQKDILFL